MFQELTDRLVCFVHPLNHDDDYRVEAEPKNKLFPVLDRIRQQGVYRLLRAEDFEIAESEYLNINHVTRQGSCSLTAQIYRRMLTE